MPQLRAPRRVFHFRHRSGLNSSVVVARLGETLTEAVGWNVVRVLVPGAFSRESDHELMHLGGPRLATAMAKWSPLNTIHTSPNPFG